MAGLVLSLFVLLGAAPQPVAILPDGARITLEIAVTDEERARGLMYRDVLATDAGMLFVFDSDDHYSFWMKDCFISLDLIWLDKTGTVVEILPNAPPCKLDPCPSYHPTKPGRAVIELNGGAAKQHGLRPGSLVRFQGVENFPVGAGK